MISNKKYYKQIISGGDNHAKRRVRYRRVRYHINGDGRVRYQMDMFKHILIISFYLWFHVKFLDKPADFTVFDKYLHQNDNINWKCGNVYPKNIKFRVLKVVNIDKLQYKVCADHHIQSSGLENIHEYIMQFIFPRKYVKFKC